MTTYNAIRDAIMARLHSKYPESSIYGEEIQQGFSRPAFFVQLVPEVGSSINPFHREKNLLLDICYFSEDAQPHRDAWKVANELDDLLGSAIAVEDRVLGINDPQPEIVDGVLHYQFNLIFIDSRKGISINLDTPGETVTHPGDLRQEGIGYTEDSIELMRELNVKEEL